jgi:hypothetical protein
MVFSEFCTALPRSQGGLLGRWVFIAPALALPDAEVGAKLDTMLLTTAVEAKGQPRALPTEVDGSP